jgi:hypothetical protein
VEDKPFGTAYIEDALSRLQVIEFLHPPRHGDPPPVVAISAVSLRAVAVEVLPAEPLRDLSLESNSQFALPDRPLDPRI